MKRINSFFSVILLATLMFSSCQDREVFDSGSVHRPSGEQVKVHLGLNIQNSFQSGLRAIQRVDEDSIGHIDVLVFEEKTPESGIFTYSYRKNASLKDTTVVVETNYERKQQLVVITNAEEEVKNLFKDNNGNEVDLGSMDMLKEGLFSWLKFSFLSEGDKWDVTDSKNYTKFPMWGESEPKIITKDYSDGIDIPLTRMVAKIEVTNNAGNFKIETLYLYNTNTTGFIVPLSSYPATQPTYEGPLKYEAKDTIRSIYTFETAAPPPDAATKATCLVIAGSFNSESTSYYRVDFLEEEDPITKKKTLFADIKRNHCYTVNITKVNARGYETPEEAFSAKSLNIEAKVDDWAGVPDEELVVDGQYYLSVSSDLFEPDKKTIKFSEGVSSAILTVETSYSKTGTPEWEVKVDSPTTVTWVTALPSGPQTGNTLAFTVTAYDGTNPEYWKNNITGQNDIKGRTAKIIVTAGRLNREIIIKQAKVMKPDIEFTLVDIGEEKPKDSGEYEIEIDAISGGVIKKGNGKLNVKWVPDDCPLHLWQQMPANLTLYASIVGGSYFKTYDKLSSFRQINIIEDAADGTGYNDKAGVKITGQVTNGFQILEKSIVLQTIFVP